MSAAETRLHEWTTLGAVVDRTGGDLQTGPFGSQLHASDYVPTGTPLVMPMNLGDNEIIEEGIARVGKKDAHRLRRHSLRVGDIVFSRRGDVGRRSIVRQEQVGWLCGTGCLAARFGRNGDAVNSAYVAHYLGSASAQSWLQDNAVGGTMPNLNTGILAALPICLPPRTEQDEVVLALEDAHAAISTLERLIAKKQAIKLGMMQQLLIGAAGAAVRLTDVTCRIGSGVTPRGGSAVYKAGGRPFVRSQNIGWGNLRLNDLAYIDEATHKTFLASEIRAGDILLNITGASIGRSAVATADLDGGNVNQHVCEVRVDTRLMDPHWVNAVLNSRAGQHQIDAFQAGGNRQGLNFQQVGSILVPAPEISQQRANGLALDDVDALITALGLRLRKTRAIKQGMMQQLLTGRTRLPVPDAET